MPKYAVIAKNVDVYDSDAIIVEGVDATAAVSKAEQDGRIPGDADIRVHIVSDRLYRRGDESSI